MRHLYVVPLATYQANIPAAPHAAFYGPDLGTLALVIVMGWPSGEVQTAWDDSSGVVEHFPENRGLPAPTNLLQQLQPWGAAPGMTIRDLHRVIRRQWPDWRD